jgi:hypothetical protein
VLSVVGDVPVDNETSVVTSSILIFAGTVFEDAPRGRAYVRVFIGFRVNDVLCIRKKTFIAQRRFQVLKLIFRAPSCTKF